MIDEDNASDLPRVQAARTILSPRRSSGTYAWPDENEYRVINNKTLADIVESIIGVFYYKYEDLNFC